MAVKVLVNNLGQHILADTKQIENKESGDVVGCWLGIPRLVYYQQGEDGERAPKPAVEGAQPWQEGAHLSHLFCDLACGEGMHTRGV